MTDHPDPIADPVSLRSDPPPYWVGWSPAVSLSLLYLTAAAIPALAGVVLFGWFAIRIYAISIAVALLAEACVSTFRGRRRTWSESHALLIGVLMAGTLPPMVPWQIPAAGALIAVAVGELLSGGVGSYLWHPVALGRVSLQILFPDLLTPATWPVLAPGRLLWGSLERAADLPAGWHWNTWRPPAGVEAWRDIRPLDYLSSLLPAPTNEPASAMIRLIRNLLPPWSDTLTGVSGGEVGVACTLAVMAAGLILLWRGFLRGPMLIGAVTAALMTAALLPVRVILPDQTVTWLTAPGMLVHDGLPIGIVYLMYHLTSGSFLFVLLLLASNPGSSPLTGRGHLLFGIIIGVVTMLLQILLALPAAPFWALLLANSLVPAIDRLTRRRVFGT